MRIFIAHRREHASRKSALISASLSVQPGNQQTLRGHEYGWQYCYAVLPTTLLVLHCWLTL